MKTTKEIRDIVIFMTLGDGYLHKAGYLVIKHCEKYKDYAEWKYKILKSGLNVKQPYYIDNGYGAYELRTYTHNFIKLYRKIIYKNNTKTIANKRLLNKLTPLGLAIWYMDDGGLSQKKRDGKLIANELMLNTHLSKEENQVIIDYFKEVWNINFSQCKNKNQYRLRCGTKEARKFIKIIKPFVSQVPSMFHKINVIPLNT